MFTELYRCICIISFSSMNCDICLVIASAVYIWMGHGKMHVSVCEAKKVDLYRLIDCLYGTCTCIHTKYMNGLGLTQGPSNIPSPLLNPAAVRIKRLQWGKGKITSAILLLSSHHCSLPIHMDVAPHMFLITRIIFPRVCIESFIYVYLSGLYFLRSLEWLTKNWKWYSQNKSYKNSSTKNNTISRQFYLCCTWLVATW